MEIYYVIGDKIFTETNEIHIYLKSHMTKGEYLYGKKIKGLSGMRNEEAYNLKIELSEKLVSKLLSVHYSRRDGSRISATLASQKFNKELLDEMYENDKDDLEHNLADCNEDW